jgi:hypothetical protein
MDLKKNVSQYYWLASFFVLAVLVIADSTEQAASAFILSSSGG